MFDERDARLWSDADPHRVVIIMDFDKTYLSKIAGLGQDLRLRGGQGLITGRGRPQGLSKMRRSRRGRRRFSAGALSPPSRVENARAEVLRRAGAPPGM